MHRLVRQKVVCLISCHSAPKPLPLKPNPLAYALDIIVRVCRCLFRNKLFSVVSETAEVGLSNLKVYNRDPEMASTAISGPLYHA